MATWNNLQNIYPYSSSHVKQNSPNLQRKPITPKQPTTLKGVEEPPNEDHLQSGFPKRPKKIT